MLTRCWRDDGEMSSVATDTEDSVQDSVQDYRPLVLQSIIHNTHLLLESQTSVSPRQKGKNRSVMQNNSIILSSSNHSVYGRLYN